jgi:hypothetical protein
MQLIAKKLMTKRRPKIVVKIDFDVFWKKKEREITKAWKIPHTKYLTEISCQSAIISIVATIPNKGFLK